MIDSHCHLADAAFVNDLDHVLAHAKVAGVTVCIAIADSISESDRCLKLAQKNDQIFCTIGVHPHCAKEWHDRDPEKLKVMVRSSNRVCAIGEIGLDFHYDNSPRDAQRRVFEVQLRLARELNLPAVIHCREAVADVRSIVSSVDAHHFVIHCCTESWGDIAWVIERGGMLSFTGIATYPKSEVIRETIRECPLDRLMIETDSPYLAPVPHRGKRNEPAFVVEVARIVAKTKGVSLQEIDAVTTRNTVEFFQLPALSSL